MLQAVAEVDFVVAQNAKFELGWLDRIGLDLHDVLVYDTMLAEWVLLGNRKLPKDLNSMLARRGLKGKEDVVGGMIKLGINPENIPKSLLLTYCQEDVRGTLELFLTQRQEVEERKQMHLVYSRCLLTPVLTDIEFKGVSLDRKAVEEEYHNVLKERNEAEEALSKWGQINWKSKQQVGNLLYDTLGFEELKDRKGNPIRTASGQRSASNGSLQKLVPRTKEQKEFLATYSRLAKLNTKLSKTLAFFKEIVEHHNGTFYGVFNQGATGTHRLSSSGRPIVTADGERLSAQLQNMPREYKRLVKAKEEGWEIWEADGSQLEFRVAADLAADEVAYEEIDNDVDIHSNTALVFLKDGTHPDFKGLKTVKEARQPAKPQTFKPLYGGTGIHKAEQAYCEYFRDHYKDIAKMQMEWSFQVLKNKELRTKYGLIFYWPDTEITQRGYITNSTAIYNYPVQGFATAEIIPIVLFTLWHKLKGWDVRIVLTVHDSIVLEVGPNVDKEKLKDIIARAFTEDVYDYLDVVYGYTFWVPLGAEIKAGPIWGSGKGEKVKMYPDERRGQLVWQ